MYLQQVVMREGISGDRNCQLCHREGSWRCLDCFFRPVLCIGCCRQEHQSLPFHRVESWTGTHFEDSWLLHTGLVMNLGHNGNPCPYAIASEQRNAPRTAGSGITTSSSGGGMIPEEIPTIESVPTGSMQGHTSSSSVGSSQYQTPVIPPVDRTYTDGLGNPNHPIAQGDPQEWEFDDDLPGNSEEDGDNLMNPNEFEEVLESVECFGPSVASAFDISAEAQPFDDFAFCQAGADKITASGVKVLVVVHRNGVHRLPVRFCRCRGHPTYDLQSLQAGLFPASFKQIKTLFAFDVLDDFLAENQECKTSAYHYFEKIRRFTCSSFPHTVPVGLQR